MPTPTVVQHSPFIYPGAITPPATTAAQMPNPISQGNTIVLCFFGGVPENPPYTAIGYGGVGSITWTNNIHISDSGSVGCTGIIIGTIGASTYTGPDFTFTLQHSAPTIVVFELLGGFTIDDSGNADDINTGYTTLTLTSNLASINEIVFGTINPNATTISNPNFSHSLTSTNGATYGVQWGAPANTNPQVISWNQTPTNNALLSGVVLAPAIISKTTGGSSSSTTSTGTAVPHVSIALVGSNTESSTSFGYTTSKETFYTTGNGTSNSIDIGSLTIELQLMGSSVSLTDAENPISPLFLRTPYGSSLSTTNVEDALYEFDAVTGSGGSSTSTDLVGEVRSHKDIIGTASANSSASGISQNQGTASLAGQANSVSIISDLALLSVERVTTLGGSIGVSGVTGVAGSFDAVVGGSVISNSVDVAAEAYHLSEPDTGASTSVSAVGSTSMSMTAQATTQAAVAISSAIGIETIKIFVPVVGSSISLSSDTGNETLTAFYILGGVSQSSSSALVTKMTEVSRVASQSTSLTIVRGAETSIVNITVASSDIGTSIEQTPTDTVRAALLSHLNDTYVVPDVKLWEIENERARRAQAFYRMGEYGIFVLLWNLQDFEAGLVARCKTCYITEGNLENTWKQPGYYKCPDCLGTSFEGGYKALLVRPSLWIWEEPTIRQDRKGVMNTDTGTVQTTGDFRMQPKDYIIRGDGSRWQVSTVQADHLDTGFGTQSGPWNAVSYTYSNVVRENESSPIYLLPITEATIQAQITQYYSRQPIMTK